MQVDVTKKNCSGHDLCVLTGSCGPETHHCTILRDWHSIEKNMSGHFTSKKKWETPPQWKIWKRRRLRLGLVLISASLNTCAYAITHTPLNLFPWQLREGGCRVPARHVDSRLSSRDLSAWPASPGWCEEGWQPGPVQGNSEATGAFWEETGFFQSASSQPTCWEYEQNIL